MYPGSFEFVAVRFLYPHSFAKWYKSKHKVQSSVDWKLNYKGMYVEKKKRECVFTKKNHKTNDDLRYVVQDIITHTL